jgi:hypothetical protein
MINLNMAVLTSKYVMKKKSPIVYATLDDDGVWQFWSKELVNESEIMVVSLKEIIDVDASIKDILDLQVGFAAMRNEGGAKWEIGSKN